MRVKVDSMAPRTVARIEPKEPSCRPTSESATDSQILSPMSEAT